MSIQYRIHFIIILHKCKEDRHFGRPSESSDHITILYVIAEPVIYCRLVCDCCLCILIEDMNLACIKCNLDRISRTCCCTRIYTNSKIMSLY